MPIIGLPLLNFAIAIFLVFVFIKLHQINYLLAPLVIIFLLAGSSFLGNHASIEFWLPMSSSTFILAIFACYSLLAHPSLFLEEFAKPMPTRQELRASFSQTASLQDRQEFYINIVENLSKIYTLRENKVTKLNTSLILLCLGIIFLVNYLVFQIFFINTGVFHEYTSASFSALPVNSTVKKEDIDSLFNLFSTYYGFVTFVCSSLIFFVMHPIARRLILHRKGKVNQFGNIHFFKLPDQAVWGYILLLVVFVYLKMSGVEAGWTILPFNLFLIFSFIYLLQAVGTLLLYFQIRMLPGVLILSGIFIIGLLLIELLVFIVMLLVLFGVFEFWFSFRKKALQPKLISNDAP
ncbi:MAG: DUF2232 domain-containing protein [Leptospirales bacterium]